MGETVFASLLLLPSSLFCIPSLSWGWNRIWENYSITWIQRIPSQFVIWRFKGRQALPNHCLTTNTSASRISAPPPLSAYIHPSIHPSSYLSSGSQLTTPIVKWQEDDTATSDCFARFKSFKRFPIEGSGNFKLRGYASLLHSCQLYPGQKHLLQASSANRHYGWVYWYKTF